MIISINFKSINITHDYHRQRLGPPKKHATKHISPPQYFTACQDLN